MKDDLANLAAHSVGADPINRPAHYANGREYEPIAVIEDWGLNFCLGNTVKYISRAGRKDPGKTLEDLKKAQWYLAREIAGLEGNAAAHPGSMSMVREFHEVFGQVVNDEPSVDDNELNGLRMSLLHEELAELNVALNSHDQVEALDALTDLQYVLDGAYLSLGFHRYKDAALAEVHRSNMSKLGADGKAFFRGDGKIVKGPNYSPPDLAAILESEEFDAKTGEFLRIDIEPERHEGMAFDTGDIETVGEEMP